MNLLDRYRYSGDTLLVEATNNSLAIFPRFQCLYFEGITFTSSPSGKDKNHKTKGD